MVFKEDNYYIEKVLNGDTACFAQLVEKHKNMAFTIAIKILKIPEDAEEVAQDAFLKAYNSLKNFKGESKFSTWFYRIVYNEAISKTRKKKPEVSAIDEDIINNYTTDQVSRSVNRLSEEEQIVVINQIIKNLPEEENLLLTLFYKKEQSIDEISKMTGYTVSNVKVKLYRIRKKLYSELQKHLEKV